MLMYACLVLQTGAAQGLVCNIQLFNSLFALIDVYTLTLYIFLTV